LKILLMRAAMGVGERPLVVSAPHLAIATGKQ
jgi:hypothetical protein